MPWGAVPARCLTTSPLPFLTLAGRAPVAPIRLSKFGLAAIADTRIERADVGLGDNPGHGLGRDPETVCHAESNDDRGTFSPSALLIWGHHEDRVAHGGERMDTVTALSAHIRGTQAAAAAGTQPWGPPTGNGNCCWPARTATPRSPPPPHPPPFRPPATPHASSA